ncbi:MAG: hypothetical protein LUG95_02260 [Clostridiales bacterium]|nr:hypothetical protein [Clostridiales bacterium]
MYNKVKSEAKRGENMNLGKDYELISIADIFENDKLVITKPLYSNGTTNIQCIDVAVKDTNGDITEVKTVDCKVL